MKYLKFLIVSLLVLSCSTPSPITYYSIRDVYTLEQVDSLIEADGLNLQFDYLLLKDHESGTYVKEYIYYKNDSVYRLDYYSDDSIKVTKRITK